MPYKSKLRRAITGIVVTTAAPSEGGGLTQGEADLLYAGITHDHDADYDAIGTASSAVSAHEAAVNPHPTYLTQAEGDGFYAPANTVPIIIPQQANAGANVTMTNQPNTEQWLGNNGRIVTKVDLTNCIEARLVTNVQVGSASANSPRLYIKYRTTHSATVGDYSDIGTSQVSTSLTSTGVIASSWIPLAAGAKADVFVGVAQHGGDGAADPAVGFVMMHFR